MPVMVLRKIVSRQRAVCRDRRAGILTDRATYAAR
jgi:hypothetical protein